MASYALRRTASALVALAVVIAALAAVGVPLADENPNCEFFAGVHGCSEFPSQRSVNSVPSALMP
jgi:hypothetical protein